MEKFNKIIEGALRLFMCQGVKNANMDDVASSMGISKKTLYKHVDNKADLVHKAFELHQCKILTAINSIHEKNENAIDELFEIDLKLCEMLKNRPPFLISNLKKYYPAVWNIMEDIRKKHIFSSVSKNLDKGKKQGLYREEVDSDIIAKLMINTSDALVNDELFPLTEYNFKNLLQEHRIYHIRGIATPKGINYLDQKLQND